MQLASSLARALDPVRLAHAAGVTPDPWQANLLRSDARQLILLCSRQSGKSTVSALLAIDEVLHRAPALVLLLAPALRQAQELFRKVNGLLGALGHQATLLERATALSLELTNGSRIVCLPGKEATIRGFSTVALLVVDEAAWVPDPLYQAIRPMLAVSQGRIILLSTPHGRRGFFFSEWGTGGAEWERVKITAHECPRITPEWLASERAQVPEWNFNQEYLCEFTETEDSAFSYDHVMRAVSAEVRPFFANTPPQAP